jgi:hypothetical protein
MRSARGTLYVVAWVVLGALAVVYLVTLTVAPEFLRGLISGRADEARVATLDDLERASSRVSATVEGELEALRREIGELEDRLATVAASSSKLDERLAAVEQVSSAAAKGSLAKTDAAKIDVSTVAAGSSKPIAAASKIVGKVIEPVVAEAGAKAASDDPLIAELLAATEQATTTVVPKPAAETAQKTAAAGADWVASEPQKPAEKKVFGLELAQSTSPDALQVSWDLLNEAQKPLVKGLSARVAPIGDQSAPDGYRLLAGPFKTAQQAAALCARLQAAGVSCSPAEFKGQKL